MSAAPRSPRPRRPLTRRTLLAQATRRLAAARLSYGHGTLNAGEDALLLVAHALGLSPAELQAGSADRVVAASAAQRTFELVAARIERRVPAVYLTGEAWLQGLPFTVDERVIVPRSFIAELLTDELYPWVASRAGVRSALDLCTGSACLAILMAKVFARARVDAVDLSAAALEVARINVRRHRLTRRLRLFESDLFSRLPRHRYGLIISNPPYVTSATMRRLPPEYRREPAMALDGGNDGFDLVDTILRRAPEYLAPQGTLVVEIGHHRARLEATYPRLPFTWPETSGGDDCVFIVSRDELVQPGALQRRPARRRAT